MPPAQNTGHQAGDRSRVPSGRGRAEPATTRLATAIAQVFSGVRSGSVVNPLFSETGS